MNVSTPYRFTIENRKKNHFPSILEVAQTDHGVNLLMNCPNVIYYASIVTLQPNGNEANLVDSLGFEPRISTLMRRVFLPLN